MSGRQSHTAAVPMSAFLRASMRSHCQDPAWLDPVPAELEAAGGLAPTTNDGSTETR
jgi:hypothetical protein